MVGTFIKPCASFDSPPWQLRQNCATELPLVFGVYWPRMKNIVENEPLLFEYTVMLC